MRTTCKRNWALLIVSPMAQGIPHFSPDRMSEGSAGASYDRLLVKQDGPVRTIEMNLPGQRNPVGFGMASELHHAVAAADADPEVRVIVIGGIGKVFSGGHDLSTEGVQEYEDNCSTPEKMWKECEESFFYKTGLDILNCDTPTIARVQGAAVLGGFSLANVCDLIVAAEGAIFWTPSARMYGFAAEIFMEPWVMGARRAKEHLFTGDPMDAREAYRVGMVNRVVPREELEDATMTLAQHIGKNPRLALKMCKRAVNQTMNSQGLHKALEYSFLLHIFSKASQSYQEEMWKPLVEKIREGGLGAYLQARDEKYKR